MYYSIMGVILQGGSEQKSRKNCGKYVKLGLDIGGGLWYDKPRCENTAYMRV